MKSKNNKKNIILFSILSAVSFVAAIVSGIYCGRFIPNSVGSTLTNFIEDECQVVDNGKAIYAKAQFTFSADNISALEKEQQTFNEPLYSQLSLADFNASITTIGKTKSVSVIETNTFDEHFDSMWIYSPTGMYYFNERIDNVYISSTLEKELIDGTELEHARGQNIAVTVNGITQDLLIGGTYLTGTYPSDRGTRSRGDALYEAFNEPILMHKEIITAFNPTGAVAMFGTNATNSGDKYLSFKKLCKQKDMEFEFNLTPQPGTKLNENIDKVVNYFDAPINKLYFALFLILSLGLEALSIFSLTKLIKFIGFENDEGKKEIIFTFVITLSIVILSFIPILIFKYVKFGVAELLQVKALNSSTLILGLIPIVITFLYFVFRRRKTFILLFKDKENNSEFDY